MDFFGAINSKDIENYINAMQTVYVDYIEIDSHSAVFLPNEFDCSRLIFHLNEISDFSLIKNKNFAFVVLPVSMLPIAKSLKQDNIIIEIAANERQLSDIYNDIRMINKMHCVCGVRIIKRFSDDINQIKKFIYRCKNRFGLFVDICPTNENLNGISAAAECFYSQAEMISLAFCSRCSYTPLESFLAYIDIYCGNYENKPVVPELLKAAECVSSFSFDFTVCLKNIGDMMFDNPFTPKENVDTQNTLQHRPEVRKNRADFSTYTSAQKHFLRESGIEPEAYEKIREIIDDAEPDIFNHIIMKDYIKS